MGEYRNARSNVHHCLIQDRPAAAGTTGDTTELKLDASVGEPKCFAITDFDSEGGTRGGGTGKYKNADGDVPACISQPHLPQQLITNNCAAQDFGSQNSLVQRASEASLFVFATNLRGLSKDDRLA